MFSFDAELLLALPHSNSSRTFLSRSPHPSTRSVEPADSVRSQPSMTSIEHAAPPYRDALSAPFAGAAIFPPRPDSQATAPPPYASRNENRNSSAAAAAATGGASEASTPPMMSRSTTAATARSNPFLSEPPSPVDGQGPFADPTTPGPDSGATTPMLNRSGSRASLS